MQASGRFEHGVRVLVGNQCCDGQNDFFTRIFLVENLVADRGGRRRGWGVQIEGTGDNEVGGNAKIIEYQCDGFGNGHNSVRIPEFKPGGPASRHEVDPSGIDDSGSVKGLGQDGETLCLGRLGVENVKGCAMESQKGHGLQGTMDFMAKDMPFLGLASEGMVLTAENFDMVSRSEQSLGREQSLLFPASPGPFRIDLQDVHG